MGAVVLIVKANTSDGKLTKLQSGRHDYLVLPLRLSVKHSSWLIVVTVHC
ncbi:unnamed protein product [Acanthoscelides obtectus]|uniref:Uncharacterized protein n=1 Tax=Acanthoscelides obtectus TaxID=200917 RepID=A0A9P0KW52_ACAOB|nr:unnamed protein product [Acanthoscelides obtectus]CAK1674815.1 hypothetical protein AOBTE_LOCUS29752 [Acanthoscelides obtectus]